MKIVAVGVSLSKCGGAPARASAEAEWSAKQGLIHALVEAISLPLDCTYTIDLPRKSNRSKSHRSGERYRNDLKSARQGSPIQLFCGSACGMLRQSVADPRTSDPEECGEGGEWYFRKRCIVDGCRCSTRRGSDLAKGTTADFRRIRQWREKAAREHGLLEQSKIAAAKWDNEKAVLRGDLRRATKSLKGAQDQIITLEARIAELTTTLESRNKQLACSLSLSGLGDCAAATIKALRDRLANGEIQFSAGTAGDVKAMIANLERPEMRTLSKMLTRRAWRIHAIRWLLRVRGAS